MFIYLAKTRIYFIILCYFFTIPQVPAQDLDAIYVREFSTDQGTRNKLTKDLTDIYESLIVSKLSIKVVDRYDQNILEQEKNNEILIHESNGKKINLDKKFNRRLINLGASKIVIGELGIDRYSGVYKVTVKIADIFSSEIIYKDVEFIEEASIGDPSKVRTKLKKLIPSLSLFTSVKTSPKINFKVLEENENPWNFLKAIYREDFSDINKQDFLGYIWNKKEYDNYKCEVSNGKYLYESLNSTRMGHKYISSGDFKYDLRNNPVPYSINIKINEKSNCSGGKDCLGRGLSIKYNKDKRSCYAYTMNDNGEIFFLKVFNIYEPHRNHILFQSKYRVKKGKMYNLGIISIDNTFYLYFDGKKIGKIKDSEFQDDFIGVIFSEEGKHFIDNIVIYDTSYIER